MQGLANATQELVLKTKWCSHDITITKVNNKRHNALLFADGTGEIFAVAGNPGTCVTEAQTQTTGLELSIGTEHMQLLTANTLRAAALRLACIDMLCTLHPNCQPHRKTLRSIWLHTEKIRLQDTKTPDYCAFMCALKQMSDLPHSFNFWATVPYFS
jgi:hypothetical protein